jgi:hypothetical protein
MGGQVERTSGRFFLCLKLAPPFVPAVTGNGRCIDGCME